MPTPKQPGKSRKTKVDKAAEIAGGSPEVAPDPVATGTPPEAQARADAVRDEAVESAIHDGPHDGPRAVRAYSDADLRSIEVVRRIVGIEVGVQLDEKLDEWLDDAQLDAKHDGNRLIVTGPDDDDSDRAADLFNMRSFALEMLPAVADIVGSFAEQGEDKDGHEEWKVARVPLGYEDDIGDFLRATLRMGKVIADAVTAGIEGGSN